MNLQNKTAIVTGGGRGIGKAIALKLAELGADVIITYVRNEEIAQETANEHDNIIDVLEVDVRNFHTINANVCHYLMRQRLKIDILVNNAGVNFPNKFQKVVISDWAQLQLINTYGPFQMISTLFNAGQLADDCSIVNIGSVSAYLGGPTSIHYAATKAGLAAITKGYSIQPEFLKKGIRVNTVAPGYIASPMADEGAKSQEVQDTIASIPLGRMGTGDDVAGAVAFLASDWAGYITGATIHVNGGLYFGG